MMVLETERRYGCLVYVCDDCGAVELRFASEEIVVDGASEGSSPPWYPCESCSDGLELVEELGL